MAKFKEGDIVTMARFSDPTDGIPWGSGMIQFIGMKGEIMYVGRSNYNIEGYTWPQSIIDAVNEEKAPNYEIF